MDLLLPLTDVGVLAQLVALAIVGGGAIWALRRHAEARILVTGVVAMTLALMGLRPLH